MTEQVAAYWRPRVADLDEAARGLAEVFDVLGVPAWFALGRPDPDPTDAIATDPRSLRTLLHAGRHRRDTDGGVIEELGCSLSLWSPIPAPGAKVSARVGITSAVPGLSNSLLVSLPAYHDLHDRAGEIFSAVVAATDPDRATWATRDHRRTQRTVEGQALVGWQTYFTPPLADRLYNRRAALPDSVVVRPLARGTWVTAGDLPDARSQELASAVADLILA